MIEPLDGRTLDPTMPVLVYRNLGRDGGPWYSVVQRGRVVGYTRELVLERVRFVVRQAGRRRARAERSKNVHAFVHGHVTTESAPRAPGDAIRYSPYADLAGFATCDETPRIVTSARVARLGALGCTAWDPA